MAEAESGTKTVSGYPEFIGSDGPGLICAGVLDTLAARLVCASTTEMFLHTVHSTNSTTAGGVGVFYRGDIECAGTEVDITECSISMRVVSECPHGLVQTLTCTSCKSYYSCMYTNTLTSFQCCACWKPPCTNTHAYKSHAEN